MIESKLPDVGTTIFTRMSALASQHGAINLSQGFPDFDAPEALCEALGRHAMAGHNQYAPMPGVAALREQIAAHLQQYRNVDCDPADEITVLPGATCGIFCAVMASVRPGDEVIVLDPCYDSYEPAVQLAGGRAVHIPLDPFDFHVDWQRVEDAIGPRTRTIMINSPHNPTGSTLTAQDLLTLQALAQQGCWLSVMKSTSTSSLTTSPITACCSWRASANAVSPSSPSARPTASRAGRPAIAWHRQVSRRN